MLEFGVEEAQISKPRSFVVGIPHFGEGVCLEINIDTCTADFLSELSSHVVTCPFLNPSFTYLGI